MNVSLTPQLEEFVREKVESGMYGSASEVIRQALRMLEERESRLKALRLEIDKGLSSGRAGTSDEVFARVREKIGEVERQHP